MKVIFKIDQTLLATSAIFGPKSKNLKDWTPLKNSLWEKYNEGYRFAYKGDLRFLAIKDDFPKNMESIITDIGKIIEETISSKEFKNLLNETEEYMKWLENDWQKKENQVNKELKDILRIDLPEDEFTINVVAPIIGGGAYLGDFNIFWGHTEDWENYSTVYLVHEMLHEILKLKNFNHEIIELVTDNELRIRLNGKGEYFKDDLGNRIGHDYLEKAEKELLPKWKKYLKNTKQDIFSFSESL